MAGSGEMSFWDHLDVLRGCLLRAGGALVAASLVLFCLKDGLFAVVLRPAERCGLGLVNIEVAAQLLTHLKVAAMAGFVCSFPYIVFELWRFVRPALYEAEKKAASGTLLSVLLLFYCGAAMGYFLIFPLALRFLSGYSVSDMVTNAITLDSYVALFFGMILLVGVLFDFPVAAFLLSKAGLVTGDGLRKYRRHAFVAVVVLGVIITSDPFSLGLVTLILYALYEVGILVCAKKKD